MPLMGRLRFLGISLLILIQLAVASVLFAYVYSPVLAIVGLVYVVYYLIMGTGFDTSLALEPAMWYLNQVKAFFGQASFKAAPYVG